MRQLVMRAVMALALILGGLVTSGATGAGRVLALSADRLAGADRYATAVEVARAVGGGSLTGLHRLIVVTGSQTPDAVVAGGLAGWFDTCPQPDGGVCGRTAILLTRPDVLPEVTSRALTESELPAERIVVIGGVRAVSEDVRDQIASAVGWDAKGGNPVVRLAGEDRSATARAVADHARGQGRTGATPLVVPADMTGDALMAGAVAYREGRLIEFSDTVTWSHDEERPQPGGRLVLASATNPIDAAVAAVLARDATIMLTDADVLSAGVHEWLAQYRNGMSAVTVIGGVEAVSERAAVPAALIVNPPVASRPALTLAYGATVFTTGLASQSVEPTIGGGDGSPTFSVTGNLPAGVTFSTTTGAFTGPASWGVEATQIAAGNSHSCAATLDGRALCWGSGGNGRLGNGSTANNATPSAVVRPGSVPLTDVSQVVTGEQHSCALLTTGTVTCWGLGTSGQIGRGTASTSWVAIDVVLSVNGPSLSGVTQISTGSMHTCAVRLDTTVACWGSNGSGRLGDGSTTQRNAPVDVLVSPGGPSLSGVTAVAAGEDHTCALMADTTVQCWGQGTSGQLGNGLLAASTSPVTVSGLTGVSQLATGNAFTCALRLDSTVACWGSNGSGRLGDGTATSRVTPVDVLVTLGGPTLSGVTQISTGSGHACARLDTGAVYCWGTGSYGRLGQGTNASQSSPIAATDTTTAPLAGIAQVAAGGSHSCVVTRDYVPLCWGRNSGGQLGDGTTTDRWRADAATIFAANPGWPATVTVTASDATGSTSVPVVLARH